MTRRLNEVVGRPILDELTKPDSAMNTFGRSYAKTADDLARELDVVVRPTLLRRA